MIPAGKFMLSSTVLAIIFLLLFSGIVAAALRGIVKLFPTNKDLNTKNHDE